MRQWTKHVVEDYRALDVRQLARADVLQEGHSCLWCWWSDGTQTASINISAGAEALRLTYRVDGQPKDYQVRLDRTPCHYGGTRVWLRCPVVGCGRRVAKLYGGEIFACRHCYRLNYASQQWSKRDWASNRSWRLRQKLGCDLGWMDMPAEYVPRSKGRHRKTHARDIARLAWYESQAMAAFEAVLIRLSPITGPTHLDRN